MKPADGSKLTIARYDTGPHGTRGIMYVGGVAAWHTLEDPDRLYAGLPKLPGETAIPAGSYRWVKTVSQRFKRLLILLLEVPDFVGVRLHGGNTKADTAGCPLLGMTVAQFVPMGKPAVLDSQRAVAQLMIVTPESGIIEIFNKYVLAPPAVRALLEDKKSV